MAVITTLTDFTITVPAYASEELELRVFWGGLERQAAWMGDESWSLSLELPVDTEHLLSIVFYDNFGRLVLGSFEQHYRTGTNAGETYTVNADQFETALWDDDRDGESNLSESRAGTDPRVNPSSARPFNAMTKLADAQTFLTRHSETFESSVGDQRPFFDRQEIITPHDFPGYGTLLDTDTLTVDIDASGNGSYLHAIAIRHTPGSTERITTEATRTQTADSVSWSGSFSHLASCGPFWLEDVDIEYTALDDDRISLTGNSENRQLCSGGAFRMQRSYALTGSRLNETGDCAVTSASYRVDREWLGAFEPYIRITKSSDSMFWHVSIYSLGNTSVETFLVNDASLTFFCDVSGV